MVEHSHAWCFVSLLFLPPKAALPLTKTVTYSQNMGQNCIGIERILVQSDQYDALYEMLSDRVKKLRTGSVLAPSPEGYIPTVDCGSMIEGRRFGGLEKVIHDAEEAGCQVEGVGETPGKEYSHPQLHNGYYFTPTIVGSVTKDMEIANIECSLVHPFYGLKSLMIGIHSICAHCPSHALRHY